MQNIIVRPKDTSQDNYRTKSDILQVMNPVDLNVRIGKVRHLRHGGVLLGCLEPEEISKLKEIADKELATNYDVRVLKSIHPRVRIVGISENFSEDDLKHLLYKQNSSIFKENSEMNIIRS